MGAPVVKSTNGYGLPVTVVDKGGLPVALASNGYGTPIIEVARGGLPITYDQGGGDAAPVPPDGFVFLTRPDGAYLTRADGAYLIREAA